MTDDTITLLAALGAVGQVLLTMVLLAVLLALTGIGAPLAGMRRLLWGYELWLTFLVAAIATAGSLFFSEVAGFVPCELCWFQRSLMYPFALVVLFVAVRGQHRAAVYLLPVPILGAAISTYHVLVEHGIVQQTSSCRVSAPGGCATRWIEEFGYETIPALALTAFALTFVFLVLATVGTSAGKRARGEPA